MDPGEATRERLLASLTKPVDELDFEHPSGVRWLLLRLYRRTRGRLLRIVFERGLDTERPEVDLDHFHPDSVVYQPSDWLWLGRALRRLDVTPSDVFVDFGSGKGRIVYQAARHPFARVIGVEISQRLNDIARANIERNRRSLACRDVELVTADAAAFAVPDDVTIAYFYYPFAGETFRTVIGNIVESLDRRPRCITIIYACPQLEDVILESGRFRLASTVKGGRRDILPLRVSIYISEPRHPGGALLAGDRTTPPDRCPDRDLQRRGHRTL
jgi:hypothetical protein